jgi:hypothetical protein
VEPVGGKILEELTETQIRAAAVAGQGMEAQGLVDRGVLAWSFLNTPIRLLSQTLVVVLPTQLTPQADLALQLLLPVPAMSLGVNHGTLRFS